MAHSRPLILNTRLGLHPNVYAAGNGVTAVTPLFSENLRFRNKVVEYGPEVVETTCEVVEKPPEVVENLSKVVENSSQVVDTSQVSLRYLYCFHHRSRIPEARGHQGGRLSVLERQVASGGGSFLI